MFCLTNKFIIVRTLIHRPCLHPVPRGFASRRNRRGAFLLPFSINLDTIEENIHVAVSMTNINMPVKLIALAEGALTGFTDEAFDLPHIMAAAILDIEALRQFRVKNLNSNWMKDLRTEVFRKMYALPIHPKNLWLDQGPLPHEKVDEIYRENIRCLIERGSFTAPAYQFKGAHFQSGASSPEEEKWENIKSLWDGWGEEES